MLQKLRGNNTKGFTLIELMIVIAIIGVLAAIAIPNFISYRNKSYCNSAESDANNVAASISDYFAIPEHTVLDGTADGSIRIVVTEAAGRCPSDYTTASFNAGGQDRWAPGGHVYTKVMD